MITRRELLKRLEKAEKRCIPQYSECFLFIEETNKEGVYLVIEVVYTPGRPEQRRETEVKANSAQEIIDKYTQPEGCKNVISFMYDYGSEELKNVN